MPRKSGGRSGGAGLPCSRRRRYRRARSSRGDWPCPWSWYSVSGRCRPAPNPAGAHFLRDRTLITRLVRASGAGQGQLVLDLGAGYGSITAALAAAGPRVIAVERDPRLAARLSRRFGGEPRVTVVAADLRDVSLPRRDFVVVASIPFAVSTELLRRLLGNPAVPLAGAELVLGWGAGCWLARSRPRDEETAWWTARYRIRLAGRSRRPASPRRPASTPPGCPSGRGRLPGHDTASVSCVPCSGMGSAAGHGLRPSGGRSCCGPGSRPARRPPS